MEFTHPLNQWEKQELIIKLRKEGKSYREIAHIAGVSLRDIKPTLRKYERKLQTKKGEDNNPKIKKLSLSSRAFKLFIDGKKLIDVAIELEIPARKAVKLWSQFLRLEKMYECFEFYQMFRYQIPEILAIGSFIRKNQVNITNISNILKVAKDISHLQTYRSEIKYEIEKLKQTKKDYSFRPLHPLGPLPRYYNW